jgi:hypothetical protein
MGSYERSCFILTCHEQGSKALVLHSFGEVVQGYKDMTSSVTMMTCSREINSLSYISKNLLKVNFPPIGVTRATLPTRKQFRDPGLCHASRIRQERTGASEAIYSRTTAVNTPKPWLQSFSYQNKTAAFFFFLFSVFVYQI